MSFSFNTILVPIDFSINTEVAIKKAVEIADNEGATIHLFHILNYLPDKFRPESVLTNGINKKKAAVMLEQWKRSIEESMDYIRVEYYIIADTTIQKAIIEKARELSPDLIVIGKRSAHSWFPFLNTVIPGDLALQTGNPVLMVKPGAIHHKIRTIVVPVADELPRQKMETLAALAKKFRIKVYLVTYVNGSNIPAGFSASSLLQAFQWLKTSLHCQVEYAVLHGFNKAKAILDYAEKINADILLVHPETETRIGWPNKHIGDVLPPRSTVQVLTVQPNEIFHQ